MICWNADVVSHATPRELQSADDPVRGSVLLPADKAAVSRGAEWLRQVQLKLTDGSMVAEKSFTGKLYTEMERQAEQKGMDHPDVLALGAAYTRTLEREKHGCEICLPNKLHRCITR